MNQVSPRPFDGIRKLIADMPGPDMHAAAAVRARDRRLTKPPGSLGRLEEIAEWLAAWQGRPEPRIERPVVAVFAGNHGVVAQGVAAYPQAVTAQMVANFKAGGAAINSCARPSILASRSSSWPSQPDRRHHPRAGARGIRLRSDHRLRHGGDRGRGRSSLHRRDGDRQHHDRCCDLSWPLWREARGLGWPRHRNRCRRARAQGRCGRPCGRPPQASP